MNAYVAPETAVCTPEAADLQFTFKPTFLRSKRVLKRALAAGAALAILAVGGRYGWNYWETGRFQVSTDDAYVKADYTTIAPKVSGYIGEVLVVDNQTVKAGQLLARIDDRDYCAARDQAKADLANAEAAIGNVDAQISLQAAAIMGAKANVQSMQAALDFALADATRYHDLAGTGFGTLQRAQQTQSTHDQAIAQLASATAAFTAAERRVVVLATQRQQAVAQRNHSAAVERQAGLNLSYAEIKAPMDGFVGEHSLRVTLLHGSGRVGWGRMRREPFSVTGRGVKSCRSKPMPSVATAFRSSGTG